MDKLESMRMFVRVAQAGGFAKAALRSKMSTAVVSRAITTLEGQLQTRLLNRSTRHMSLTEPGRRYLQHCERILAHVELADAEALGAGEQPSGKLRIHSSASVGRHYVTPTIVRYTEQYCDVSVELILAQRMPDMINEGFDVVVDAAPQLKDSSLVSQRVGTVQGVLCASSRYVSRHGAPKSISDLERHTCIQMTTHDSSLVPWVFDSPEVHAFVPPRLARFTANVAEALTDAIHAGMGIGVLPLPVALQGIQAGTLVHVLPEIPLRANNVYALYASLEHLDAKIKTFVDCLRETMGQHLV